MSLSFTTLIGVIFLLVWGISLFFFSRINRKNKAESSPKTMAPVYRLADQWLAECQKKIEELIQKSEAPLSAAQNELLELRLEASRLPQGVKNLKLVRESLANPLEPRGLRTGLVETARYYLGREDCREGKEGVVFFKSPMGEMPCLEVEGGDHALSEAQMKALLPQVNRILSDARGNAVGGGFLYFANQRDYEICSANAAWMEGLKSHNLMVLDLRGLMTLLISLRLSKDTDRVVKVFEEGVQSTAALTGQTDRMAEALSSLSTHSLRARTGMEGSTPGDLKDDL